MRRLRNRLPKKLVVFMTAIAHHITIRHAVLILFQVPSSPYTNSHALLYIEHVLVRYPPLTLFYVAMKIDNIANVESFQKTLSHSAKGWIFEVSMICDKCEYPG